MKTLILGMAALALSAPHALSQGLPPEVTDLIRQIRRNMIETERSIDQVESEATTENATAAKKRLDELLKKLDQGGKQITNDIDEVIKKIPRGGGGGGGGGGQSSSSSGSDSQGQDQSGSKDRNQRDDSGGQPEGESKGQQQQNGGGDSNGENPEGGENRPGRRKPEDRTEVVPSPDDAQRWGFLPEELRQRLLDRNFREFTPEYQRELRNYFRRTFNPKR